MVDIDKIIDEFNKSEFKDKLVEEMTREQLKKEFNSKLNEQPNEDYMRVLDGTEIPEGEVTTVSTLPEGTLMSIDMSTRICNIKEHDQRRIIKFNKSELLSALGLTNLVSPEDEEVELKVTIVGRDCDDSGHPIDVE